MPKLTATLDSIQAALTTTERQAVELLRGVSHTQANWQPNQGRSWSICQCLDHLSKVNSAYVPALQDAVASPGTHKKPTSDIVPGFLGAWFIQQMDLPVRGKFKSPGKGVPASGGNETELLRSFLKSHEPIRAVLEAAKSVDVNRLRFKNPFIGMLRFTVGTGLMVINAHERRHLWQAEQVKKAAGYPAV